MMKNNILKQKRFWVAIAMSIIMFIVWIALSKLYYYILPKWVDILFAFITLPILMYQTMRIANWIQNKYKL